LSKEKKNLTTVGNACPKKPGAWADGGHIFKKKNKKVIYPYIFFFKKKELPP
jgi:hypothetical protein